MGQIRAGKLRPLAVTTAQRTPALPDVQTVGEQGLKGYEVQAWFALFAPAGTPGDIVNRLQAEVARAMTLPEFRERFLSEGAVPVGSPPAQLGADIAAYRASAAALIEAAGIKVE
jgi:tripartite-type tricarboxylate transporter receptor subunit TctC